MNHDDGGPMFPVEVTLTSHEIDILLSGAWGPDYRGAETKLRKAKKDAAKKSRAEKRRREGK